MQSPLDLPNESAQLGRIFGALTSFNQLLLTIFRYAQDEMNFRGLNLALIEFIVRIESTVEIIAAT